MDPKESIRDGGMTGTCTARPSANVVAGAT